MTKQLAFGFVKEIDQATAEKAERDRVSRKKGNQDYHLESCLKEHPPENEELDIMSMGIRLCRHIHGSECEECNLDVYNHCPDILGTYWCSEIKQRIPIKVCLKDFLPLCKEWGLKYDKHLGITSEVTI